MYLLDTNVISELRRPRPRHAVVRWIENQAADRLFLSAVTIGEIQAGIEITREQDVAKAEEIEAWFEKVLVMLGVAVIDPFQSTSETLTPPAESPPPASTDPA